MKFSLVKDDVMFYGKILPLKINKISLEPTDTFRKFGSCMFYKYYLLYSFKHICPFHLPPFHSLLFLPNLEIISFFFFPCHVYFVLSSYSCGQACSGL